MAIEGFSPDRPVPIRSLHGGMDENRRQPQSQQSDERPPAREPLVVLLSLVSPREEAPGSGVQPLSAHHLPLSVLASGTAWMVRSDLSAS